ncbi:MAG: glycosyltransferase, partial [Gallionella sp.]
MRVTIAIPAYQGERFIRAAVDSALSQVLMADDGLPELYEVLVRDDGSTDGTLKALEDIQDTRLRIVAGDHCGAIAKSFQATLDLITTPFFVICGQDDLMDTNYLSRTMAEMKDGVAMVGCQPRFINADGSPYINPADPRLAIPKAFNMSREQWQALFKIGNIYFGINTYLRTAVI